MVTIGRGEGRWRVDVQLELAGREDPPGQRLDEQLSQAAQQREAGLLQSMQELESEAAQARAEAAHLKSSHQALEQVMLELEGEVVRVRGELQQNAKSEAALAARLEQANQAADQQRQSHEMWAAECEREQQGAAERQTRLEGRVNELENELVQARLMADEHRNVALVTATKAHQELSSAKVVIEAEAAQWHSLKLNAMQEDKVLMETLIEEQQEQLADKSSRLAEAEARVQQLEARVGDADQQAQLVAGLMQDKQRLEQGNRVMQESYSARIESLTAKLENKTQESQEASGSPASSRSDGSSSMSASEDGFFSRMKKKIMLPSQPTRKLRFSISSTNESASTSSPASRSRTCTPIL